ncbi:MAG: BrnA antitoxin family protein [Burkholderiaceae bacterium]|jgi:uncharacterized protein (DUF4415 family)|nr:BrnA antitoxin family protein [Burkholderiaceae bacterium]
MKKKPGTNTTVSTDKTDWARVRAMKDADITFTDDAPTTSTQDWADAIAHRGLPVPARKEQIALRVDADVLSWYRQQGPGWQTRMNAVLRAFRDAVSSSA